MHLAFERHICQLLFLGLFHSDISFPTELTKQTVMILLYFNISIEKLCHSERNTSANGAQLKMPSLIALKHTWNELEVASDTAVIHLIHLNLIILFWCHYANSSKNQNLYIQFGFVTETTWRNKTVFYNLNLQTIYPDTQNLNLYTKSWSWSFFLP